MVLGRRLDIRDETGKRQRILTRNSELSSSEGPSAAVSRVAAEQGSSDDEESRQQPSRKYNAEQLSPTEAAPDAVTTLGGVNAITTFTGDFQFLHPDHPCAVAYPATPTDLSDFQKLQFFPSVSVASLYALHEVEGDRVCEAWEPYTNDEATTLIQEKQTELRDIFQDCPVKHPSDANKTRILELLTRDKYQRHKNLQSLLMSTGDRPLVYSDATNPVKGTYDMLIEPDAVYGKKGFAGENLVGRILMKVREDLNQGHRALFRWLIQMTPIERDQQRKVKLRVSEGKSSADGSLEQITTHDLERKYDIREYFEPGTKVDRQQLFVNFPDNEKEDFVDMTAAWRRKKKQKLMEDLLGTEGHEEQAAQSILITIGKLPENEIICLNPSVSRTHVAIVPLQRSKVAVIDLGSKGGTTLNGVSLMPWILNEAHPGDTIRVGQSQRVFTVQFRALKEADLIAIKRAELEKQLSSINASLTSNANVADESEKTRTIRLDGLSSYTSQNDLEDGLAAYGLRAERISLQRGDSHRRYGNRTNRRDDRRPDATAFIVFRNRMDAWKARESLNDRGVKGRTVHVSNASQAGIGHPSNRRLRGLDTEGEG